MPSVTLDPDIREYLERRVGAHHLALRIGIERDYESRVFGQGRNFFHLENWYSVHSLIRNSLRLAGLHGRGRRNARAIRVEHNEVWLPHLPESFDGFTLLQISDLHLDMAPDIPHALVEAVRPLHYDVCVLTGDFRAQTFGPIDGALEAMAQVRLHLNGALYGILGNHDSLRMVPGLEALGVRLLLNERVILERDGQALHLAGIDDPHYYRADNLEKASAEIPGGAASILLAHSPEIYRHAAHSGFDLMLCGHTHGGQVCLPGGRALMCNAKCPRAFCRGPWRFHRLQGYTSRGSGVSIVDVRLNCPPEVTLHRLRRGEA